MLSKKPTKRKMLFTQLIVIVLYISIIVTILPPSTKSEPPASGDWIVTGDESYSNQTITVEGNLIVRDNASLTLNNVTLIMKREGWVLGDHYELRVDSEGALYIYNSIVTASNPNYGYKFWVLGTMVIESATVKDIRWAETMGPVTTPMGGIEISSSSVRISNSTISNSTYGIRCVDSIVIVNNSIISNDIAGIYSDYQSSPLIANNIISNSDKGIWCNHASPIIANNTITSNDYGISCDQSSPSVFNNSISNNDQDGIYNSYSSPTITNNIVLNNNQSGIYNTYSSPTITNNTISNNNQSGIYNIYSSPIIENNTIKNNRGYGIHAKYQEPIIKNNTITDNEKGRILQEWNLKVKVTDAEDRPVTDAIVSIKDYLGDALENVSTNSEGYTNEIDVAQYEVNNDGIDIFHTPHTITAKKENISISTNVTVNENKEITIVLELLPDLLIGSNFPETDDIVFSNNTPTEDTNITITVTVHNRGYMDASNITISFFDNDILIDNKTVDLLLDNPPPNPFSTNSMEISVIWTTKKGNHTIKVVLDPENRIKEIREDNNEVSRNIYVSEKIVCVTPPPETNILNIIIAAIVVAAIFIIGGLIIRKRKKGR